MIRISRGKPKLVFIEASNDMSHFMPSCWGVKGGDDFLVTDEMYCKLLSYTDSSLLNPPPPEGTIEAFLSNMEDRIKNTLKLNPSGTQLWQFNALLPDMKTYVRQIALFGEPFIYFPTLADRIKKPILELMAATLNRLRYFKVKKECEEWDRSLNEFYAKRKQAENE